MRPTELNFRSPKEKTPDAGNPCVTFDGRKLAFIPGSTKGTLPLGRRFAQYDNEAKKTGYRVGPGAYDSQVIGIGRSKSKGPVYKDYHGGKDVSNNGYFFYGNHLVFEPAFVMKSRSVRNNQECAVDASQLLTRPQTSNSFYRSSKRSNKSSRPASAKSPYMIRSKNL